MEYKLNEIQPGKFEVVSSMPVVMGTFTDPDIARKFMLFLKEEEIDAQSELDSAAANADVAPARPPETTPQTSDAPTAASGPDVEPKDQRAPYTPVTKLGEEAGTAPEISDDPWTDDELGSAFRMLSAGDTLKVVAARHGKSWTKLRSRWAFHKKKMSKQETAPSAGALVSVAEPTKTPLEKVTTAVAELAEQDKCRICARHFTPTLENLDLCARCSHGA
ncbi:hypothetical protein RA27_20445 [Ruegeria sp. ANG-R]|uniref:hypothetical protein n=1 Tax=Ruegeria sp. ANG-R TaxID=1577903 RepID=UPI00057E6DBB|nr:hypothetical protein [Ruegeria sp. ANG-R]KIC38142.1 hypothetical protein RA27_20445 [Ruegeria sp. ANG-R]